jgi:23S rRNA (cytosine1962-C5)-methyltransferase
MFNSNLQIIISQATQHRAGIENNTNAFRLFNGFYEGFPGLILDRYDHTLVIFNHNTSILSLDESTKICKLVLDLIPQFTTVLIKQRQHPEDSHRKGILIHGKHPSISINEGGVQYAIDLNMNQDASFYLDTRNLRQWLRENMAGLTVLNTFAYTGSFGVAAGIGGAKEVVQTDLNPNFLELASTSWQLNRMENDDHSLIAGDFFRIAGKLRNQKRLFDCVILDPPFFSQTSAGKVDLQQETTRLVNKIRPLVAHQGYLVVINNALFVSGSDFLSEINMLCESEYLEFFKIIPVPMDITGYPPTIVDSPPVDPTPFNHPTKIAILKIYRKDKQT